MNLLETVRVVDARVDDWDKKICDEVIKRRNFAVILKDSKDAERLKELLCCSKLPQRLERFSIYGVADVLEPADYSLLLETYSRFDVRFVEQLDVLNNVPPAVKPFMLYCELRGIISDHNTFEEAGQLLQDYIHQFARVKLFPMAGIYKFEDGRWNRVRNLI